MSALPPPTSMVDTTQQQQFLDQPKKRTRRRLRVSCVECTRRRQKCDRQQPCSLCKTRGVEHLCRWETEPFARPPPARPPGGRAAARKEKPSILTISFPANNVPTAASSSSKAIAQTSPISSVYSPTSYQSLVVASSPLSQSSQAGSPLYSRSSQSPFEGRPQSEGLKEAALALARMQLTEEAHHLAEGSFAYALQELTNSGAYRVYELPLNSQLHQSIAFRPSEPFVPRLPDKAHCEALLLSFHEHVNWSIGIPYNVLFSSHELMWERIRADPTCLQKYNPYWVALLLSMFCFSPACATEEESRDYFNQAMAARKLQEDRYASLDAPPQHGDIMGAVYSCLGAAFLARYLQDRGRITEAWKVVGSALRDAQNVGLHNFLAPGKSKNVTDDQRTFMLVSWHLCVEFDRYLSLFLGRPTVVRSRDCNVQLPSARSDALALDGSTNIALLFQAYFISMTKIVSEAKEKFLSAQPDNEDGHAYFDIRMGEWLANLPSFYKLDQTPNVSYDHIYPKLYLQRMTLRSYYTCSCLFYHRALAYSRPAHQDAMGYGWDQSQLAQYAISVLHSQGHLLMNQWWERQVPFDISMYMFEASVTLGVTLLRDLYHPDANEWRRELASAIEIFENLRERDFGQIVPQAIRVLRVLQELCADPMGKRLTDYPVNVQQEEAKIIFPSEAYNVENAFVQNTSYDSYNEMWNQYGVQDATSVPPAAALYTMDGAAYPAPVWPTNVEMSTPYVGTMSGVPYA
ncbi:uncharacterized protein FOMMEDRAFT_148940 [Fomitiporia mediterranea MF3/22]|uniref:uncharacterized protein n=1 Tax=Fomitiporia mediterranea (strain MF3/22) TaxID=694068 RepID=UPI000440744A|nr:uncharacterized protein FOMMEDRAFT_148940 [Fomitiporia mediterranea MF3/22]EJC98978.1 hypothetical protein FOMMEDRAFT_148940 [Fomitiporia mediterranea MF3/22]